MSASNKFKTFWKKHIWVGQKLTRNGENLKNQINQKWHVKYKKMIAIGIPAVIVWVVYFSIMLSSGKKVFKTETNFGVWTEYFCPVSSASKNSSKHDIPEAGSCTANNGGIPRYLMGIVMVFGSLVAGATSEGAGAIAFPVMTLVFHLPPSVARDFSLMSQSVGMPAAMFTLFYMRVLLVQIQVILLASFFGVLGIVIGICEVELGIHLNIKDPNNMIDA